MSSKKYLDFDLLIERSGDKAYRARVLTSPAGQATGEFSLPFSDIEQENYLLRLNQTRRGVRRLDSPETETAKTFGGQLFKAVFDDDLMSALRSSLEEAEKQKSGLRIRLRLNDAPELVNLPWEFLYNPSLNRFIFMSVDTPLVRYLELPERITPLSLELPLRILVMISSPSDYPKLDVEQEWGNLKSALCGLEERGLVSLDRLESASPLDLQYQLRRQDYHIFHFIGHGGFNEQAQDGVLLFEDENQRGQEFSGQKLGTLLHDEKTLRLVILNACEGAISSSNDPFAGVAQSLVQQGIPAVIAMQREITDGAAIIFAREFYTAIAEGFPVDAAMSETRKAISYTNDIEWSTPVLYMRAPDGKIFDVEAIDPAKIDQKKAAVSKTAPLNEQTATATRDTKAAQDNILDLEPLYIDGLSAYWVKDWPKAWEHFRKIEEYDPKYKDLPAKLAEVKKQITIGELNSKADEAIKRKNWDTAIDALEKLVTMLPEDADIAARLANTREDAQLDKLYNQARQLSTANQWEAVRNIFNQIQTLQADYPDPEELLVNANKEIAKAEKKKKLETLYKQGITAMEMEQWQNAVEVFQQVKKLNANYRDTNQHLTNAESRVSAESEAVIEPVTAEAPQIEVPQAETPESLETAAPSVEQAHAPAVQTEKPAVQTGPVQDKLAFLDKLGLPRWTIFASGGAVVVILILAMVLLGGSGNSGLDTKATEAAETQAAAVAAAASPTSTKVQPTATTTATQTPTESVPTPTQTEIVVNQPINQPIVSQSPSWFSDDFSSNNGTWFEEVFENASIQIEDGQYVFTLADTDDQIGAPIPVIQNPSRIDFQSTILALGPGDGSYSVYCFYPQIDNAYEIRIQAHAPDYYIYDENSGELLSNGSSQSLNTGDFATNYITVICQPGYIELYINSTFEARVELDSVSTPDSMELVIDTWDSVGLDGFKVAFDDIYVTNSFFENFTSNVHGWFVDDNSSWSVQVIDDGYSFQIYEPSDVSVYPPIDYIPTTFSFTTLSGSAADGYFGVRCNVIDNENFYEIIFRNASPEYAIWQVKDGEWLALMDSEFVTSSSLDNGTGASNNFLFTCSPGYIYLQINGTEEQEISISDDSSSSVLGSMALYASIWNGEAFGVIFDNLNLEK